MKAKKQKSSYMEQAVSWETSMVKLYKAKSALAVLWATFASLIAIGAVAALMLIIPLKTYEPYVISVDEQTGFLQELRPLTEGNLHEDESVTIANIVRFIRARENFDMYNLIQNHYIAQLLSTGKPQSDFNSLLDPLYRDNLPKKYGRRVIITSHIKSIARLNDSTYSVRFRTVKKENTTSLTQHWVSIVRFRYTQKPISNEYRFDNPLGFQVIGYTKEQETILQDVNGNRISN